MATPAATTATISTATLRLDRRYLVADAVADDGAAAPVVPVLGSTEKLLRLLGYAVPVRADRLVAAGDGAGTPRPAPAAEGAYPAVADDDLRGLSRVSNVGDLLVRVTEDLLRWRHREATPTAAEGKGGPDGDGDDDINKQGNRKDRNDRYRNRNRGDQRQQALEAQRERLQRQLSLQSGESGEDGDGGREEDRCLGLVRALNSVRLAAALVLPLLTHPRCRDESLLIGTTRLKSKTSKSNSKARREGQAFLLGEFVFDVVSVKTRRKVLAALRDLLGLLAPELPADGADEDPAWRDPAAWGPALDRHMRTALDALAGNSTSVSAASIRQTEFWSQFFSDPKRVALAQKVDAALGLDRTANDEDQDRYMAAIQALQRRADQLCKGRFRKDARITVYGSCLANLSLGKGADVDMSLYVREAEDLHRQFETGKLSADQYEKQRKRIVFRLCMMLRDHENEFRDVQAVIHARVPVVKGTWVPAGNPHTEDGSIQFDICLLNEIAVVNSRLIREYSIVDPRARQLMILVKSWAKENGVCSAKDGSLSSYAWINLVIFYLQNIGLVPNLQSPELMEKAGVARDANNIWHSVRNLDTFFVTWNQAKSIWTPSESLKALPVSALLYGFFSFYANDFPTIFYMIGIKRGAEALVPKTKFHKMSFFFCIEDPFETHDAHIQHDLSAPVGDKQIYDIIHRLRAAAKHLAEIFQDASNGNTTNATDMTSLWPNPADAAIGRNEGGQKKDPGTETEKGAVTVGEPTFKNGKTGEGSGSAFKEKKVGQPTEGAVSDEIKSGKKGKKQKKDQPAEATIEEPPADSTASGDQSVDKKTGPKGKNIRPGDSKTETQNNHARQVSAATKKTNMEQVAKAEAVPKDENNERKDEARDHCDTGGRGNRGEGRGRGGRGGRGPFSGVRSGVQGDEDGGRGQGRGRHGGRLWHRGRGRGRGHDRTSDESGKRKYIVAANWKCNGTLTENGELIKVYNEAGPVPPNCEVVCCPPALYLSQVISLLRKDIQVGGQNCGNNAGKGAYTGEIGAFQLKDMGCQWVILGHSERRQGFGMPGEPDELCADKAKVALDAGLKVMFCIGEKKEERETGKTMHVCARQLKPLVEKLAITDWENVVIAYEPVWAIGTGLTATPEMAQETHASLRKWISKKVNFKVAQRIRIQYGGSMKGANAADLLKEPDIDGGLIGGASLMADFFNIVNAIPNRELI